jgi:drug/metabolite transporter (DMT)-like permease
MSARDIVIVTVLGVTLSSAAIALMTFVADSPPHALAVFAMGFVVVGVAVGILAFAAWPRGRAS